MHLDNKVEIAAETLILMARARRSLQNLHGVRYQCIVNPWTAQIRMLCEKRKQSPISLLCDLVAGERDPHVRNILLAAVLEIYL